MIRSSTVCGRTPSAKSRSGRSSPPTPRPGSSPSTTGGYKQSTISTVQCVVRPAFEMAVDDDMIRKNPFKFKLSDVIPKDAFVRTALTREQQDLYLQFFQEYGGGSYYDDIVILLGTGLRVSELYGLTKADLDFTRRCLYVRRSCAEQPTGPISSPAPKPRVGSAPSP